VRRPLRGFPALLERPGLLINSHDPLRGHVLKHIRRTTPGRPALLGGAQGKESQKRFCVRFAHDCFCLSEAGAARLAGFGFGFCFSVPCAPPSSGGWSGDVGEDCLSA
jgi:hypothetical protein